MNKDAFLGSIIIGKNNSVEVVEKKIIEANNHYSLCSLIFLQDEKFFCIKYKDYYGCERIPYHIISLYQVKPKKEFITVFEIC